MAEPLQVTDESGNITAYLTPDDGVSNCIPDLHLDPTAVSQLTFNITDGPKLQYLVKGAYIIVDGHRFVIRRPPKQTVTSYGLYLVTAVEDQTSLGKYYPTVQRDIGFTVPYTVSISATSGGYPGYASGSAGNAIYALLQGCSAQLQVVGVDNTVIMEALDTGWTVGTVDVTGTYDLKCSQKTLLECILLVQSIWGGYLVFDSVNRTISLRDEEIWQPTTGFSLIIGKNQKQYTVEYDQDVSTRIIPYGKNGLSIASMNDDVPYIENRAYADEQIEEVWVNSNISDQIQLFNCAQVYLAYRSVPQPVYETDMLDLRTVPGYEQETFDLGDIIGLWTNDQGVIQQRIVGLTYDHFCPWICQMVLGIIGYTADRAIAAMISQLAALQIAATGTLPDKAPVVVDASCNGAQVILTFSEPMAAPPVAPAGFTVTLAPGGSGPVSDVVTAVALGSNITTIVLTLTTPSTSDTDVLTVAYASGTVKSAAGVALGSFTPHAVTFAQSGGSLAPYMERDSVPWANPMTFTLQNGYIDRPVATVYGEDGGQYSLVWTQATVGGVANCYSSVTITPLSETPPAGSPYVSFSAICTGMVKR